MSPRAEERLAQGEGASQPIEIFHTLRKRGKNFMGLLGSGVLFSRVSPSDVPFFLRLYYLQAPATQATSFIALRPFSASF